MTVAAAGELRAWGWVEHLRSGGSTPWPAWTAAGAVAGRDLPGAQQLELLRCLNQAGSPDSHLVDRVLAAALPGRGQPELALAGAAPPAAFGPPPVDPAMLPPGELLRVATALLAEDLVAQGAPTPPRRRRHLPLRTSYRLAGDPELVVAVRDQLVAQRRAPGGRSPRVIIPAAGVDRMLADAWSRRAFGSGALPWGAWLDRLVRDDHLPGGVDVVDQARRAARWAGADRVHVVLDSAQLAELAGAPRPVALPEPLAAHVPELARRVSTVLGLHVPGPERAALLRHRLRPRVGGAPGPALTLPESHRAWAQERAERLMTGLYRADVTVHGDPATLLPEGEGVSTPDLTDTVLLAVRLLLRPDGAPVTTEEGA